MLSVNQAARIPIQLTIGLDTELVQVQANAALIETSDTTLGKTVGEREILDLPLNGRNFSQLGLLQPGVERQGNFSESGPLFNLFAPGGPAPLPGSQIPFVDPTAQKVLDLYPLPNAKDANGVLDLYNATQILRDSEDQFGVRVDHYLSSRDSLTFRYMFLNGTRFDPFSTSGAGVPGFPVGENHRTQHFVPQLTHAFSPSLLNITRLTFLRNKFLFDEHLNNTSPASFSSMNPRWASRPARRSSSSVAEGVLSVKVEVVAAQTARQVSAPAGLLYPGDPGVPGGLIPTEKKAFAPRVGLAWASPRS